MAATRDSPMDATMQGPADATMFVPPGTAVPPVVATATPVGAAMEGAAVPVPPIGEPPMGQPQLEGYPPLKDGQYGEIGEEDLLNMSKEEHKDFEAMRSIIQAIGYITLLLNMISISTPMWRKNGIVVMGYDYERSWGLWSVMGKETRLHHDVAGRTCDNYSAMNADGICSTPICEWYKLKCELYVDFMVLSYSCGGILVVGVLLHTAACMWTSRGCSAQSIGWAAACWPIAMLCQICGLAAWIRLSSLVFEKLDEHYVYPFPSPGYAFYLGIAVVVGQLANMVLASHLKNNIPPSNFTPTSSDSEPEDEFEFLPGDVKPQPPDTRDALIFDIFNTYDKEDGLSDSRLRAEPLRSYAKTCGYEGTAEEWEAEYKEICKSRNVDPAAGMDLQQFTDFVSDVNSSGYSDDQHLTEIWVHLFTIGGGKVDGPP